MKGFDHSRGEEKSFHTLDKKGVEYRVREGEERGENAKDTEGENVKERGERIKMWEERM